jgi:hypothetical protein
MLREIGIEELMSFEERVRSVPCGDPKCGTVLAWPDGPLCNDCAAILRRAGLEVADSVSTTATATVTAILTEPMQLTLFDADEEAA